MDLLELGLLWPLCGGRAIGRGIAWRGVCRGAFFPRSGEPRRIAFLAHARKSNRYIGIVLAAKLGTLPITVDSDAERRSRIQVWKTPLVRDWHGGFLGTDLSGHGVHVRVGDTWQKRRRQPKASRQKARAEGCEEPRGRPDQKSTVERSRDGAPYISPSIFCGGGSVGSKPQTPIKRNRPHCGINARCKRCLERPRRRPWALWDGIGAASDPAGEFFADDLTMACAVRRGELEAYYQALIRDDEKAAAGLNDGRLIFDDLDPLPAVRFIWPPKVPRPRLEPRLGHSCQQQTSLAKPRALIFCNTPRIPCIGGCGARRRSRKRRL